MELSVLLTGKNSMSGSPEVGLGRHLTFPHLIEEWQHIDGDNNLLVIASVHSEKTININGQGGTSEFRKVYTSAREGLALLQQALGSEKQMP